MYNQYFFLIDCLAIQERISAPNHQVFVSFGGIGRFGCGPEHREPLHFSDLETVHQVYGEEP